MKALRYVVFLILLLALILLVAVPYGMGWWIKGQYKVWVDQANQQNPAIQLSVSDYQRGWFHSTATLKADIKDPVLRQQLSHSKSPIKLPLDVDLVVDHGLVVMTKSPTGNRHWAIARAVINGQVERDNIDIDALSSLNLNNQISTEVMIHQLSLPLEGGNYSMKDALIHSNVSVNGEKGRSNIVIPTVVFELSSGEAMSLSLDQVSITNNFNKSGELVFGKRSVAVDKVTVKSGKHLIQSHDWLLSSEVLPQGDTTNLLLHAAIKSYISEKEKSGPLSLDFSLKQMNTQALSDFMKDVADNDVQSLQVNQMVFPLLSVLKHGVEGSLALSYQSSNGPISVQGHLSMPDSKDKSIFAIIPLLKADCNITVPDLWMQQTLAWLVNRTNVANGQPVVGGSVSITQAKQAIQRLVEEKMLVQKADQLTMNATIKSGEILVNGLTPDFTALTQATSGSEEESPSPAKKTETSSVDASS
ncbi:MAG: hypothetical protein CL816_02340 [Coxiellaceae bacterium]|nr:hypothetical protein [Coxiellaceae bacterium]